jgi:hypothetical protein
MQTYHNSNIKTILSANGKYCVELLHSTNDPSLWIIRRSKKFLWLRLHSSIVWFLSKQQAIEFAHSLE